MLAQVWHIQWSWCQLSKSYGYFALKSLKTFICVGSFLLSSLTPHKVEAPVPMLDLVPVVGGEAGPCCFHEILNNFLLFVCLVPAPLAINPYIPFAAWSFCIAQRAIWEDLRGSRISSSQHVTCRQLNLHCQAHLSSVWRCDTFRNSNPKHPKPKDPMFVSLFLKRIGWSYLGALKYMLSQAFWPSRQAPLSLLRVWRKQWGGQPFGFKTFEKKLKPSFVSRFKRNWKGSVPLLIVRVWWFFRPC